MSDAPVSRGKFLRSLGSSVTGMALGTGIATAAHALATRLASALPETAAIPVTKEGNGLPPDPFIFRGSPVGSRIAITFDDGPTPGVTERILDELKQRRIPAIFFMIGQRVVASPELARRVLAEGHEIGNHTYTHPKLNALPDKQVDWEIQKAQDVIGEVMNYRPACFRPPYLAFRRNQAGIPRSKGLSIICGDVDSHDWSQPGETKIVDTIVSQAKPGSIIVCHDMHPQTANCIGQVLDGLLERGFTFVTPSLFVA